jgi:hypothetical protein
MPALVNQSAAPAATYVEMLKVFDLANAELTLHETGGVLDADGTEQIIYITDPPLGNFKPLVVKIDMDEMDVFDIVTVRVYYRIALGGAWRRTWAHVYNGTDGGLLDGRAMTEIELLPSRFGVKVTLEHGKGFTLKDFPWEVFEES